MDNSKGVKEFRHFQLNGDSEFQIHRFSQTDERQQNQEDFRIRLHGVVCFIISSAYRAKLN
jgi:hypothetical protein